MKLRLVVCALLFGCQFVNETSAAEHAQLDYSSMEKYRPSQAYQEIDFASYPEPTSLKDCVALSSTLIKCEIEFWQETQKSMLEEYKRLGVIVSLLAQGKEEQRGKMAAAKLAAEKCVPVGNRSKMMLSHKKIDAGSNLSKFTSVLNTIGVDSLDLELRLLNNDADYNAYQVYKSHGHIISILNSFLDIITDYKFDSDSAKSMSERLCGQELLRLLEVTNERSGRDYKIRRGLIQSSTINPDKSTKTTQQLIREQTGKFGASLNSADASYALCDVEYSTDIFFPIIAHIFDVTFQKLQQEVPQDEVKSKKGNRPNKSNRKKRKAGKQGNSLAQDGTIKDTSSPQEAMTDRSSLCLLDSDARLDGHESPALTISQSSSASASPPPTSAAPLPESGVNSIVSENSVSQPSEFSADAAAVLPVEFAAVEAEVAASSIVEDGSSYESVYPKGKYNKSVRSKNQPASAASQSMDASPAFQLSVDSDRVARTLLGLERGLAMDNVEMKSFIILIKELEGKVGRVGKKCIHFMARCRVTQQWHAVAMHPLHGDNPTIIPRNTPYWKKAKKLLLDINLTEVLEKAR